MTKGAALLLAVLLPASVPQAAPLQDDDSLLQPRHTRPDRSAAASALDDALRVETSPGQRDLDLLLETRGTGPAAMDPAARRRTVPQETSALSLLGQAAATPGRPASAATQPRLVALAAEAGLSLTTGSPFAGRAVGGELAQGRREWMGAVGTVVNHPTLLAGANQQFALPGAAGQDDGRPPRRESLYDSRLYTGLQDLVAYLRENRYWVLGAASVFGLGLLLVRGAQAILGRRPDPGQRRSPPSTLHGDLAHPVVHRHRRRSSRRL